MQVRGRRMYMNRPSGGETLGRMRYSRADLKKDLFGATIL
jgi:hypothetical protein